MNVNRKLAIFTIVIIAAAACYIMASSAWSPTALPYDDCYALVIGLSNYEGTEDDDSSGSAVNDASDLYCALRLDWPSSQPYMQLRLNSMATHSSLTQDFDMLFDSAGPNDLAIIYWGAHGGWVGSDYEPIDENGGEDGGIRTYHENDGFTDDELAAKINAIPAGTKVVILDSCHMGEFASELDMPNTLVLLSTEESEWTEVYEYADPFPSAHKPFSYYFNRAPDTNGNGLISIEEAFTYAYPLTVANSEANGNSQHPILIDNVAGDVEYLVA